MIAARFSLAILTILILLPLTAAAQENQPTAGAYCPHLTRDLKYGDTDATTGGQVTELQKFLASYYEDYPEWGITGNFRNTTKQFVIRFQTEQNLPAFGYVGPLTRAAIARVCGTQAPPPPPPPPANQCTPLPPQTQTLSCPTGQTGAITQTRYSTCPGPTWGPWTTTANTCTAAQANVQPPTVSLTINNQSTITLPPNTTYTVAWSSSNATSCSLTNAQGGVTAVPPNTTGSSQGGTPSAGTTWTYTFSCTNAGGTTTKTASVTGQTQPVASNVGACTYKGQTYQEGSTISINTGSGTSADPLIATLECDNRVWAATSLHTTSGYLAGGQNEDVCDDGIGGLIKNNDEMNNLGCPYPRPAKARLPVRPRHGTVPLIVRLYPPAVQGGSSYTIYWGDGASEELGGTGVHTHTYAASGTYTISYTLPNGLSNSANIRVDPAGTTLAPQSTQLANALSALESALRAILDLLR